MKRCFSISLSFLTLLSVTLPAAAQKKKEKQPEIAIQRSPESVGPAQHSALYADSLVFSTAMRTGDFVVALNAAYYILAKDTAMTTYRDSLALLYYLLRDYPKCVALSNELLEKKPGDVTLLELAAVSYKNLREYKEALAVYEKIYAGNAHIMYLYEIAELQYRLKRYDECLQSAEALLEHEEAGKVTLSLGISEYQSQRVPLTAAAWNMIGMVHIELKENEKAGKALSEALKIMPEFVLAKENLKIMAVGDGER